MLSKPTVLNESRVPERELVVHRREALERLQAALLPDTGIGVTDLAYLLGPTGTGKTMVGRLVVEMIVKNTDEEVLSTYINCWNHYKRLEVLRQTVGGLYDTVVHLTEGTRPRLLDRLQETDGRPRYVILDEADQLAETNVLYDLLEMPDLHLVLIANKEKDLFQGISERLQSRLTVGVRIECNAYSVRELTEILEKRAAAAFHSTTDYETRHLEFIAEHADGDARIAIQTLRVAANTGGHGLTDDAVTAALPEARTQLRRKNLDALNEHQRLLYEIITDESPIKPGDITAEYREQIEDPRSDRTVRKYLSKLRQYDLVEAEGEGFGRTYMAIGD